MNEPTPEDLKYDLAGFLAACPEDGLRRYFPYPLARAACRRALAAEAECRRLVEKIAEIQAALFLGGGPGV